MFTRVKVHLAKFPLVKMHLAIFTLLTVHLVKFPRVTMHLALFTRVTLQLAKFPRVTVHLLKFTRVKMHGQRPATSWVHYATNCNPVSSAPEDGQNNCTKRVELTGIINEPLLLHLVGCLYYLYQ